MSFATTSCPTSCGHNCKREWALGDLGAGTSSHTRPPAGAFPALPWRVLRTLAWVFLATVGCGHPGADTVDATTASDDATTASDDAATRPDAGTAQAQCPAGTANPSRTLASSVVYAAAPVGTNPAHDPFGAICLPITAAGQGFYLESKVTRGGCTSYDACETSLEIKCFDAAHTQLRPQLWAGENFLNGAPAANLFARLMFISTSASPVTCNAQFFNHDHGIAGGTITVEAGSTFTASGTLQNTAATADSGGGNHLSSAHQTASMKPIAGWHMPAGGTRVDYIGDIQVTECHGVYPANATDPATQCTAVESGADATVAYWARAVEEYANGTPCHVTDGLITTKSVSARTHHKMLYTQVASATHTPGCANVWHLQVEVQWKSGRSFMIGAGPYGQGMVRGL